MTVILQTLAYLCVQLCQGGDPGFYQRGTAVADPVFVEGVWIFEVSKRTPHWPSKVAAVLAAPTRGVCMLHPNFFYSMGALRRTFSAFQNNPYIYAFAHGHAPWRPELNYYCRANSVQVLFFFIQWREILLFV